MKKVGSGGVAPEPTSLYRGAVRWAVKKQSGYGPLLGVDLSGSFPARSKVDLSWVGVQRRTMAVSQELLDILVCPKCKGDLVLTEERDGLICRACRLKYEIKDDIPIMLIDEAVPLDQDELGAKS